MPKIRIGKYNSEETTMNTKEINNALNDSYKLIEHNNNKAKSKAFNIMEKIKTKLKPKSLRKIVNNIIALFYNLLSFYFYYLSLEGCFDTQSKCIPLLSTMFLVRILIFGFLFSINFSFLSFNLYNTTLYIILSI